MDIRFSGKNIDVTEGMQTHLREKLLKLDRYAPRIVESHVVLEKQKYLYEAEVTLLAKNLRAFGEGESKENIYAAIDQACLRVEKQLKKFREKVKSHHKGLEDEHVSPKEKIADEINSSGESLGRKPQIVSTDDFEVKPMSAEEAGMQLEISEKPFMVFSNAVTNQINVIYKRDDGDYGLIEPKF